MGRNAYVLGQLDQANGIRQNLFKEEPLKLAYTLEQFDERTRKPFPSSPWVNQFRQVAQRRAARNGNRGQVLRHPALVFGRKVMAPLLSAAILLGISYAASCPVVASAKKMTLEERRQINPPIMRKAT